MSCKDKEVENWGEIKRGLAQHPYTLSHKLRPGEWETVSSHGPATTNAGMKLMRMPPIYIGVDYYTGT